MLENGRGKFLKGSFYSFGALALGYGGLEMAQVSVEEVEIKARENRYGERLVPDMAEAAELVAKKALVEVIKPLGRVRYNYSKEFSIYPLTERVMDDFNQHWYLKGLRDWRSVAGGSVRLAVPGFGGIYLAENKLHLPVEWKRALTARPGIAYLSGPLEDFIGIVGHEMGHYFGWKGAHTSNPDSPAGTAASVVHYFRTGEVKALVPENPMKR